MTSEQVAAPVYQGQFGTFSITAADRQEVKVYRGGLAIAALCLAIGSALVGWQGSQPWVLQTLTVLYAGFWLALGVSLMKIHIYLKPLHQLLKLFWLMGGVASLALAIIYPTPLLLTLYQQPLTLLGAGFTFAALTGIFFKEAFCFGRLETQLLTPIVPTLLLGHLLGWLPPLWEGWLLAAWASLFLIFAGRKAVQAIPDDIGDKSVFAYLQQQAAQ
ncbi:DUF2301 domain-containing membrane protein [Almyronema epifaneia]|uniref:DUF2301 domain-containing membrane protein n=1 Tax=Almyronema epifaneia S1 TaxID=2991925 RepID=A0ABW6IGA4_9CYAN